MCWNSENKYSDPSDGISGLKTELDRWSIGSQIALKELSYFLPY